jgi:acetolactate synthase-1/2/3 large subunit
VPVIVIGGNILEANKRGAVTVEWPHSAIDPGAIVRDYVKWDDQPASLQHFAESAVRAYKIAVTPPMAPVMLSLDAELQENPIENRDRLHIPKLTRLTPPQGDDATLAELAKMLVAAENPVIICDRVARTPAAMPRLVELAESLQCAVIDNYGRMNFPSRHPLNQSFRRSILASADLIVAMELNELWGTLSDFHDRIVRSSEPRYRKTAKLVTLGSRSLYMKSNYQDFGRYQEVDLDIAGDAEASLPILIEQVKKLTDERRKAAFEARGKKLAAAHLATVEQARSDATIGWDATPITTARLCAELYNQIKDEDWSLVGTSIGLAWPHRLWNFDKPHRWNGVSGGGGVGYTLPSSLGAALANKSAGRLTIAIGGDGDFMFVPSTLWTAAHRRIPLLYIVHNNRAYHQEYMYLEAMAARHGRGITHADIGTTLKDPFVDYAILAKGFGVYAEGPINDPGQLGPVLKRAVAMVKTGQPALLDVVMDQR